jgi:hypothetical protein
MRLELADFPVRDVRFSKETHYRNGVLEIDKQELIALILEDKKVLSVNLDMAFPGEQTRIVNIRDVLEPRIKVSGPGCVFPGILGPLFETGDVWATIPEIKSWNMGLIGFDLNVQDLFIRK